MSHNNTKDNWVVVGRFGAPFGVMGWSHVHSFTHPADNLLEYENWHIESVESGQMEPIKIHTLKPHAGHYAVKLIGCDDRNQASLYTNLEIYIPRSELPELEEDEHYWADLIGLSVFDKFGQNIGTVTEILETGANDVLMVTQSEPETGKIKEILIPYILDQVILSVDLDKKQMVVDWEWE